MLKFIQKLLGKAERLVALAQGPDRESFVRALGQSDIFVIAAFEGDGLDPASSPDELLCVIEEVAKDLSTRDGFEPFTYDRGGIGRMPFFSSMTNAQTFCGEFSRERNRIFPFQILGISGAVLAGVAGGNELILNDRSSAPYELATDDLRLLKDIWGEPIASPNSDTAESE